MPPIFGTAEGIVDSMSIVCPRPWMSLEVMENGVVKACCWSLFELGNVQERAIVEIWRGERVEELRRRLLERALAEVCPSYCPMLNDTQSAKRYLNILSLAPRHRLNKRKIERALATLEISTDAFPLKLRILPTMSCNIRCIMCKQDHDAVQDLPFSNYSLTEMLPYLSSLSAVGGEPLVSREYREFITQFQPAQYPDCRFKMVTNGLLLHRGFHDLIPGRFEEVIVSVDGATKETYERIRKGASWEILQNNLLKLVCHPRRDYNVIVAFTIMRSNYHELPLMFSMIRELGINLLIAPVFLRFSDGEQFQTEEEIKILLEILEDIESQDHLSRLYNLLGTKNFYNRFLELFPKKDLLTLEELAKQITR
jgi:MoaA/NifB/PqqE/SkfB family radical SAM enzyme